MNKAAGHKKKAAKLPPAPIAKPRYDLWIAVVLLAAIAIVYGQVATHEFLNYDDPQYVTANPHVRSGLTGSAIAWAFTAAHDGNWIPLTWISHMLDCQLFGQKSGWHHLTNVLIHAANALLLLLLLRSLTGALWPSAFVAFVFALHPLHIESVAWIAERKDVLSTFFFLATIWAYRRYVERPAIGRYTSMAALFVCSLLSKPMAVTLPLILLLLDVWPLRRLHPIRRAIVEKLPLVLVAAGASIIAFVSQREAGAVAALHQIPIGMRLANALISYVEYIGAFVWPVDLAVFYPYLTQIAAWMWISAAAALIAGSFFILRARRIYLTVGWLWYLITLLPVIGLIQVGDQARADRYTYIPLIGITIMLAWGAREFAERRKWNSVLLPSLAVTAIALWTAASWWNVQYWKTSVTLFEHALAATNDNFVAHTNLGDALRSEGRIDDAIPHFQSALRIRPNDEKIVEDLAAALQDAGRTAEALPILKIAVQQHPDSYKSHLELGHALVRTGDPVPAAAEYLRALQIRPDGAEAHYGLGGVLSSEGRDDEARPHLEAGLPFLIGQVRARPGDRDAHYNLGTLYGFLHRYDDAIAEFTEALRLVPADGRAHFNLAVALAGKGLKSEAVDQFAAAVRLMPEDTTARLAYAGALEELGRQGEAIREYEAILRINPNSQEARRRLDSIRR